MKRSFVIALSGLSLCTMPAQETPDQKEEKKPALAELIKGLGSDDFKKRDAATEGIWGLGDSAFELLADLEKSKDPELALRASRLLHKLRCGIRPDTPADIVEMLEEYQAADRVAKKRIAGQLQSGEHYEYLYRLLSVEEEPEFKKNLREMVFEIIPKIIKKHIVAGEMNEARKLLKLGTDFPNLIHYGNFLLQHDELDAELARLKDLEHEESQARYLAYLRVKGDIPLLQKEAKRLGDEQAYATASLLLGDAMPVLKLQLEEKRIQPTHQTILKLRIAQEDGDQEAIQKILAILEKMVGDGETLEEAEYARRGLYASGFPDRVKLLTKDAKWFHPYEAALILDRPADAAEILGLTNGKLTDEWLQKNLSDLAHEWQIEDSEVPALDVLRQGVSFLEARGDYEAVAKVCSGLFDAARQAPDQAVIEMAESIAVIRSRGAIPALAREVGEFDLPLGELINSLFNGDAPTLWLYNIAREIKPEITNQELITLVFSYNGAGALSREEFLKWDDLLEEAALKKAKAGKEDALIHLTRIWYDFGSADRRLKMFQNEAYPGSSNAYAAMIAVNFERWEEALSLYESLQDQVFETDEVSLYRRALLEERLGKDVDTAAMKRQAYFLSSGDPAFLSRIAYDHLDHGDEEGAYELLRTAILRSEHVNLAFRSYQSSLLNRLAVQAMHLEKWREASALHMANTIPAVLSSSGYALNVAFEARFTKGLALFSEGKEEEGSLVLESAHALQPGGGALADYFFPALREYGLDELHDRLCQKTLGILRGTIEMFPTDHSAKNTFAWVASRANRNLEEADQMIRAALKVDPLSPALLDTMGEVQFALGNREEAVESSMQAVDFEIFESAIRRQLRRFRSGEFPKP
ncbi:hypothetical protein N9139_01090 [Akkermansiaceae bacterium]|nr:hypothetical protein [Akkermansiaceae bacterium]